MSESQPTRECNLILKGGVTSGVVYARAIGRLSGEYRFRAIAGSSAGAIAAAFVAAAEYGRQGGDRASFDRLQARSEALPGVLTGFFQAEPKFRRWLAALFHLAPGTGRARIGAAILCLWPSLLMGALAGAGAVIAFYALLGLRLDIHSTALARTGPDLRHTDRRDPRAVGRSVQNAVCRAAASKLWALQRDDPLTAASPRRHGLGSRGSPGDRFWRGWPNRAVDV